MVLTGSLSLGGQCVKCVPKVRNSTLLAAVSLSLPLSLQWSNTSMRGISVRCGAAASRMANECYFEAADHLAVVAGVDLVGLWWRGCSPFLC